VGSDPIGEVVIDGPHLEIDGLHGAEGSFHRAQTLVGTHDVRAVETLLGERRSEHVDAVQRRLAVYVFLDELKSERGFLDNRHEVLLHLVLVDDLADPQADLVLAFEPTCADHGLHFAQFRLGGLDHGLAGSSPVGSQFGIAAGDKPFAGVVGMGELEEVAFVEQAQLQGAAFHQGADRPSLQRGDPRDALKLLQCFDLLLADHTPIADQDHFVDAELIADLGNLGQQGCRVAGVALEDRDRHRTASPIGEQPVVDLQLTFLAVSIVPQRCQGAAASLDVAGAEVVEHQPAFREMPVRQFPLDPVLPREEPVHGRVTVVLGCVLDVQEFRQGRRLPPTRRSQLAFRREDPGRNHGNDEVPLSARPGGDQVLEAKSLHRSQHRINVSMQEGSGVLHAIR